MTAPNEAKSNLARAVCLPPSPGHEVLRRPAGFCSRRALASAASLRVRAGPAMRVQPESVRAELRARSLAAVVSGRGGRAVLTSGR
jgi:hypothetical protein